jgi:predicted metal-dependent hydrolase
MSLAFLGRKPERVRAQLPERIVIAGRALPLEINRSPRARRLLLRADPARAAIRLTLPRGVAAAKAEAFLEAHRGWLAARVAAWPRPIPLASGAVIPFGDGTLTIDWSPDRPRAPQRQVARLLCGGPGQGLARRVESWLRTEARRALSEDSAEFAACIGLGPPPVRVGDPKSRWGSCSARGALAYSWRLILAPDYVRRAVAAHEVAHLRHHDHGKAFHALADRLSGGTSKAASRWLAEAGPGLHWIGRGD